VQARTLEFYRQIGIVDDVLAAGLRIDQLTIRTPAGVAAALALGEFGEGLSPYSFAFALPQDCLDQSQLHGWLLRLHVNKQGLVSWDTLVAKLDDEGLPRLAPNVPSPRSGPGEAIINAPANSSPQSTLE
jgi:hypothetical protein